MSKIIVTCAVTGSIHTPSMSPHLPVTGGEIAAQAISTFKAPANRLLIDRRGLGHKNRGFDVWLAHGQNTNRAGPRLTAGVPASPARSRSSSWM